MLGGPIRGDDCRLASSRRLMPETVTWGGTWGARRRPVSDWEGQAERRASAAGGRRWVSARVRVVLAEGDLLHVLAVQALTVFVGAFDEALSRGLLGREDRHGVIILWDR